MSLNHNNFPIGVFDSGLGGLTVVKELMRQLPGEDIVYYGDTARVPYGTKSKESIIRFSEENTRVLLKHKVKMVVVACNSSSSYALSSLKRIFDVPIIGVIKPGAQKAAALSKNKKIGVIATKATIQSQQYVKELQLCDSLVKIYVQACPLFVPMVEEGWLRRPVTVSVAREYFKTLKKADVDTLILGCTHYPLLKTVIQKVMGPKVTLVDSAKEIAREVKSVLKEKKELSRLKRKPRHRFLISDEPQEFKKIARNFLGREIHPDRIRS